MAGARAFALSLSAAFLVAALQPGGALADDPNPVPKVPTKEQCGLDCP
jgi:hypothetical protein